MEKKYPRFSLTLQRKYIDSSPPKKMTFFLVRHGESKWNKAQQDGNITGLFNLDHALTVRGIQQALDLRSGWQEFQKDRCSDDEIVAVANPTSAIRVHDLLTISSFKIRKLSSVSCESAGASPQQTSLNMSPNASGDGNQYSVQDISKIDADLQLPCPASDGTAPSVNDLLDLTFESDAVTAAAVSFADIAIDDITAPTAANGSCDDAGSTAKPGDHAVPDASLLDLDECDRTVAPSIFLGGMDNFSHIGSMITSFSGPSYANYDYAPPSSNTEETTGQSFSPGSEVNLPTGMSSPVNTDPASRKMSRSATMTSEGTNEYGFLKLSRTGTMTSDGANEQFNGSHDPNDIVTPAGRVVNTNFGSCDCQDPAGDDYEESESSEDEDDIENEPEVERDAVDRESRARHSMRVAQMMSIGGFNLNDLRERMFNYRMQFLKSSRIYSSPFTRAIETAIVALHEHRAMMHGISLIRYVCGLKLYLSCMYGLTFASYVRSCIREIKGVGGLDSVGVACGEEIAEKVFSELESKLGKVTAQDVS
jgi:hypothetical protein